MSDKNDSAPKRSIDDIEADLQRTREELTSSVNELVERLDPRTKAKEAADGAKERAGEFSAKAKSVAADAQQGDTQAIGILAGAAATAALAAFLIFKR